MATESVNRSIGERVYLLLDRMGSACFWMTFLFCLLPHSLYSGTANSKILPKKKRKAGYSFLFFCFVLLVLISFNIDFRLGV